MLIRRTFAIVRMWQATLLHTRSIPHSTDVEEDILLLQWLRVFLHIHHLL